MAKLQDILGLAEVLLCRTVWWSYIMSKGEDRRCGQVAELFRPFLEEAGDWCVVRSEQFGYIVLCYYVDSR